MGKRTNVAVWLDNQNRWQIKVQKDNIRKTFTCSKQGRTGQRECHKKADEWLDDGIEQVNIKMENIIKLWLKEVEETTSTSYYKQCEQLSRLWINPKIGKIKIEKISEQHLQDIINYAYKNGKSKKTLKGIRGCLVSIFKFARKSNYTTLHLENITIPRNAPEKQKNILMSDGLTTLFASDVTFLKNRETFDTYIYAYRLQVATGLRPGELIGLKWADINNSEITIKRSINAHQEETKGKNKNANRVFALMPLTKQIIEQQKEMLKSNGIISEYIFPNRYGEVTIQGNYYKRWKKYCAHNKIEFVTPYELRHTFVSAVKSLPEGLLKQTVGHSKSMDTYGVYSHEMDDDKRVTADLIQGIFDNILNPKTED